MAEFLDFIDMINGGGAGVAGDKFEGGGILSSIANALFSPYGSAARLASQTPVTRPQARPQHDYRGGQGQPAPQPQDTLPADFHLGSGSPVDMFGLLNPQLTPQPDPRMGPTQASAQPMPAPSAIMESLLRDAQTMQTIGDTQRQQRAGNTFDQYGGYAVAPPNPYTPSPSVPDLNGLLSPDELFALKDYIARNQ